MLVYEEAINGSECSSTDELARYSTVALLKCSEMRSKVNEMLFFFIQVCAEDYYYAPGNVTRATLSGINAYRSALTLDWLAAEDTRQRELVAAYETEPSAPVKNRIMECVDSPKPSTRKVGKLMLELLKNLEGDDGILVPELIQMLMRSKLLMETSILDSEPDLDSLMKTPMMIMGEPHVTFPRVLAIVWMLVTDATTTRNDGWCSIKRVNEYLGSSKPTDIAKHLRVLEPVVARARFIMEEFIQNMTPLNLHQDDTTIKIPKENKPKQQTTTDEIVDVLAELPRANGEKDVKRDDKKQEEFSDLDMEYASTRVLEQAQQFADLEDVTPCTCYSLQFGSLEHEPSGERHNSKLRKRQDDVGEICSRVKPTPRDIVRRVYAILPYFDKDHANTAFLHKYRATFHGMSEGEDLLDREAALYTSILTPLVFLQQYRDTWCLLERFHRAVRLYQISHPTDKRSALKLLQNFRAVNQKIRSFIMELPERDQITRSSSAPEMEEEEFHDKKDIRYLKELIKNLG